jgi:hypothetical protein
LADEKKSVIKKSISFRSDVLDYAQAQADKFHGGNLSGFLTFLVSMDKYGMNIANKSEEVKDAEEKVREKVNTYQKSEANEDYINSILDI